MALYFEITRGPGLGSSFQILAGQIIGRGTADILLEDPNVSGKHARIEVDNKGQLILVDLNSSNGVFLGSKKVKKAALIPGLCLTLGTTDLLVKDGSAEKKDLNKGIYWKDGVVSTLQSIQSESVFPQRSEALEPRPFRDPLVIQFVRGLHSGKKVTLGYGPRRLGSNCRDLDFIDPSLPSEALEILPNEVGEAWILNKSNLPMKVDGDLVTTCRLDIGTRVELADLILVVIENSSELDP